MSRPAAGPSPRGVALVGGPVTGRLHDVGEEPRTLAVMLLADGVHAGVHLRAAGSGVARGPQGVAVALTTAPEAAAGRARVPSAHADTIALARRPGGPSIPGALAVSHPVAGSGAVKPDRRAARSEDGAWDEAPAWAARPPAPRPVVARLDKVRWLRGPRGTGARPVA